MFLGDLRCSSGGSQSHSGFETVINPPLETGQSSDHEDSGAQSSPESSHSDLPVNYLHVVKSSLITLYVVQLRNPIKLLILYFSFIIL